MASLSSLGVGSGLDAETIVTKLVAIEKQPADALTTANTKLDTKVSTWGKIQSTFSALQDAAKSLNSSDFWGATTGASSDDTSVSVATTSDAIAGAYNVMVNQLASAQYLTSGAYASKTAAVGEGEITIELGTYGTNNATPPAVTFNAKAAASTVKIEIGPGDNTLEKIRDRINGANAGVTASLINDAAGTRLIMRGSTGEENGFRVSVSETATAPGLSALAYDGTKTDGSNKMTQSQAATNAKATINGISVSSASNTMSNVLDGVTLKLNKVTSSAATITVAQDTASIQKGITDFVSAYNSVVSTIRVQTLYDASSKTGGPLQGDATARGLLSQLRSLMGSGTSASSTFGRLSDIGIDIKTDGTLSTKTSKLTDAMANMTELKKFFSNSDETVTANNGMSQMLFKLTKQVLDTDGSIDSKTSGLKTQITRNKDKIEQINDHATLVETRLRAQYTALDTNMAKLNGLSTYVTAQLAALNNS
ncbi:flagellar filament capping protein FliD [Aquabacterium sp.]|uniref:flagellar filament capping protein FliD n=1 Tax=Aquabacterium sp. TaxID=1872578 RepID=UPI0025C0B6CB|nr:flagellar filament capping protein FliD [Aquabacterium sp.]